MTTNSARRELLLDAGLRVLAAEGSRGLTHRAIDARANLPLGTCVNYFRSRDILLNALARAVFVRLTPSAEALRQSAAKPPSRERLVELMHELMQRVMQRPDLQIALWELRLESTRRPRLRELLAETLGAAFGLDLTFHREARLPGGRQEVVLLHLAIEGLILNTITLPEVLGVGGRGDELIELIVERLVPEV
jgi:DNA-binding transcriptional regulator YbjK